MKNKLGARGVPSENMEAQSGIKSQSVPCEEIINFRSSNKENFKKQKMAVATIWTILGKMCVCVYTLL